MKEENENDCEKNFKEDFSKNCLGELSNSSSRRRNMTVSEDYLAIHLGGLSNRFY